MFKLSVISALKEKAMDCFTLRYVTLFFRKISFSWNALDKLCLFLGTCRFVL